jgi:hypothetical protein
MKGPLHPYSFYNKYIDGFNDSISKTKKLLLRRKECIKITTNIAIGTMGGLSVMLLTAA